MKMAASSSFGIRFAIAALVCALAPNAVVAKERARHLRVKTRLPPRDRALFLVDTRTRDAAPTTSFRAAPPLPPPRDFFNAMLSFGQTLALDRPRALTLQGGSPSPGAPPARPAGMPSGPGLLPSVLMGLGPPGDPCGGALADMAPGAGLGGPGGPGGPAGPMGPLGGGPMPGGPGLQGTATNLAAMLSYRSRRCYSLTGNAMLVLPHGSSSPGASTGSPPALESSAILTATASYIPQESVTLSLTAVANLAVGNPASSGPQAGQRSPEPDTATISASASVALRRGLAATVTIPIGFQSGLLDPMAGFILGGTLANDRNASFSFLGSVTAALPVSALSREQAKLTTVTGVAMPTLTYRAAALSLTSLVSYSLYQQSDREVPPRPMSAPPGPPPGPPPPGGAPPGGPAVALSAPPDNASSEVLRAQNNLSLTIGLGREVSVFSSASAQYRSTRDASIHWETQAVPIGISYTPGDVTLAGYFAVTSDPLDDQSLLLPSQPLVGATIGVRFGDIPPGPPPRISSPPARGFQSAVPAGALRAPAPDRG